MFKLYGNIAGWKQIIQSYEEKEIIETICEHILKNSRVEFLIVYYDFEQDMDIPYKSIQNIQEFQEYVYEYKTKSENIKKRK